MFKILLLFTSYVFAQHDHADHVDPAFLQEEAIRAAKLPFKNIVHEINQHEIEIEKLKNKWRLDTEQREDGEKGYESIWNKHFVDIYRKMADRFLILTHVCEEIFDHNVECRHNDPWEDKFDGRGSQFRQEFIAEIHEAIHDHVAEIKIRRQKNDDL